MANQIADSLPDGLAAILSVLAAVNADLLATMADLASSAAMAVIALLLLRSVSAGLSRRMICVAASLLVITATLHFLVSWLQGGLLSVGSVATGAAAAVILCVAARILFSHAGRSSVRQSAAPLPRLNQMQEGPQTEDQELLRTLFDNIPDLIFFKNRDGQFVCVNPAMAQDAGLDSREQVIGLTEADLFSAETAAAGRKDEQWIMSAGQPLIGRQQEVVRLRDGAVRWMLTTRMPWRDKSGEIIGTFGLARDITTLRLTHQWLSDSQERFELAAQGLNDGLWDWNVLTDQVWYAPRFRELLGFEPEDTQGFPDALSSFTSRLHPEDRDRVMQSVSDHFEHKGVHDQQFRLRTSAGQHRWFRGRAQAAWNDNGQPERLAGSIQDIHESYLAQTELANTKLQLQQALTGGNVGMWDWNIATDEVVVSPELMLQLGEDPERPWTSLQEWETHLHPDDRQAAVGRTRDYIEGRTTEYKSSFRLRHSDGSYRWILSRGRLFRDDAGKPCRFIGVHVDMTDQRRAEEALAESEARFRGIFNQTFQFIGLLTPDGTIVDANRTAMERTGVSISEVRGRKFWDTVWWSHSAELQQRLRDAVARAAAGSFERFEATHPTADGQTIFVDFSLKPVKDDAGRIVYLIPEGRDVTELKNFQAELKARSDELERSNQELEQFAYVASHDLQEPLRTTVGFCELLALEYSDKLDADGQMYLDTIVGGGKRMQDLIRDLLEYSRVGRSDTAFRPTSLGEVLDNVQALLRSAILESAAEITVGDLPVIEADAGQMIRLFQNLLGNSIKYRSSGPLRVNVWAQGDDISWKIFVSDNGIGIPEEFSQDVFVIFRRLHTRDECSGTGIGLAVCRRIMERHGGQIRLVCQHPDRVSQDSGSTFEITFRKAVSELTG